MFYAIAGILHKHLLKHAMSLARVPAGDKQVVLVASISTGTHAVVDKGTVKSESPVGVKEHSGRCIAR